MSHDPHGPAPRIDVALAVDAIRYANLWQETLR